MQKEKAGCELVFWSSQPAFGLDLLRRYIFRSSTRNVPPRRCPPERNMQSIQAQQHMLLRKCIECFKKTGHPVRLGIIDTTPGGLSSAFSYEKNQTAFLTFARFPKGILSRRFRMSLFCMFRVPGAGFATTKCTNQEQNPQSSLRSILCHFEQTAMIKFNSEWLLCAKRTTSIPCPNSKRQAQAYREWITRCCMNARDGRTARTKPRLKIILRFEIAFVQKIVDRDVNIDPSLEAL